MISIYRNLFIHLRLFIVAGIIILLFILAFPYPALFPIAQAVLVLFGVVIFIDGLLIFNRKLKFRCWRSAPKIMSLGNHNPVNITLENESGMTVNVKLVDELPAQLQDRDNEYAFKLGGYQTHLVEESLRPVVRGEYHFGDVKIYVSSFISLLERRITFPLAQMIPVYPSLIDVKKYELRATSKLSNFLGVKKIRRLGHSYEFEQISEYQIGDDYQDMNWKATSKVRRFMVNKYTDEKAQPVYCFIDKSRYMRMPFNGLSLLDYAVNASLIISSTALKRHDKAGLMTFSDKVESLMLAENSRGQLQKILQTLYREDETKIEANYELMYMQLRKRISGRSLIFLFANFDTYYALERVLPVLRKINKLHLLVVIVFENTELEEYYSTKAATVLDIYNHTIAKKLTTEKKQVLMELKQHAIQVIYTKPENLSLDSLNKYLELKSRGMI